MRYLTLSVALVLAFTAGWWASSWYDAKSFSSPSPVIFSRSSPTHESVEAGSPALSSSSTSSSLKNNPKVTSSGSSSLAEGELAVSSQQQFYQLLDASRYQQAMDVFHRVRERDAALARTLRGELLNYLAALMESEDGQAFTELADAYLALVFDDVDVLLLLADFNQRTDYYFEALNVFQLAREYAYSASDKKKVGAAFASFLSAMDQRLLAQNNRYVLSQIYMQADGVGLLSVQQQLRLAEIHLNGGDEYLSEAVLERLLSDVHVGEQAASLMAQIRASDTPSHDVVTEDYESVVPLVKSGNQYIAVLGLDDSHDVRLLIDTGASMTTLSEAALARIGGGLAGREVGSRMFRTANGVTKGRVLQLDAVRLGEFELADTHLAVLNFDMGEHVDGLLGMNVLGAFEFRIVDADGAARLLLRLR